METLHNASHACKCYTTATEDLHSVVTHSVAHSCCCILEKGNTAANFRGCWSLQIHHVSYLIHHGCDALQTREHLCQLLADNGLLHQLVAKHLSLHCPLEDFLCANACSIIAYYTYHP